MASVVGQLTIESGRPLLVVLTAGAAGDDPHAVGAVVAAVPPRDVERAESFPVLTPGQLRRVLVENLYRLRLRHGRDALVALIARDAAGEITAELLDASAPRSRPMRWLMRLARRVFSRGCLGNHFRSVTRWLMRLARRVFSHRTEGVPR